MEGNPYERFSGSDLILRDELAIDRTNLSNERTVLAYIRASITLIIAGLSFAHFVQTGYLHIVGFLCVPLGISTGVFGYVRYARMKRMIETARAKTPK
jgi:putative membrane protein